jgi:phosphoserine phosphatase
MEANAETILVRISGPDHPGITAGLMDHLAIAGAEFQDVEQIVIRGRLSLSLAITVPSGHDLIKELLLFGWQQKIEIDFDVIEGDSPDRRVGLIVTVLGNQVDPGEFGAVAAVVANHGGNIERIVRLAKYPVMAYELLVTGDELELIREALLGVANRLVSDIAVQREGLGRRAARLIVLDVDSTLIQNEIIDLVAEEAGCLAEVSEITNRAMAGEVDFIKSLEARVELLAGLDATALERARARVVFTPGARTFIRTLNRLGFRTAIVSGGFTSLTDRLAAELGIDHSFANTLEIVDGKLTGRIEGPIVDRAAKAAILRELAEREGVPLDQVVAVGDGANDLDMLGAAGLGIAFNAKQVVQDAADVAVNVPYLDAVLFVLGVRRGDIEAADAE